MSNQHSSLDDHPAGSPGWFQVLIDKLKSINDMSVADLAEGVQSEDDAKLLEDIIERVQRKKKGN